MVRNCIPKSRFFEKGFGTGIEGLIPNFFLLIYRFYPEWYQTPGRYCWKIGIGIGINKQGGMVKS